MTIEEVMNKLRSYSSSEVFNAREAGRREAYEHALYLLEAVQTDIPYVLDDSQLSQSAREQLQALSLLDLENIQPINILNTQSGDIWYGTLTQEEIDTPYGGSIEQLYDTAMTPETTK